MQTIGVLLFLLGAGILVIKAVQVCRSRPEVDPTRYRVEDRGERELRMPRRATDPRGEEVVLERRPVVEEVVVRRRIVDDERSASDPSRARDLDRDGIPDDRERRL